MVTENTSAEPISRPVPCPNPITAPTPPCGAQYVIGHCLSAPICLFGVVPDERCGAPTPPTGGAGVRQCANGVPGVGGAHAQAPR